MKKKSPLVSIIMNCHNGEKYLEKSLKSIIDQTYLNWELVFFDNFSKDQSQNVLRKFKDKRIKLFESKKYLNLYEARNEAVKKATGKYVSFLDTDDVWDKNFLSSHLQKIIKSDCDIVYSKFLVFQEKKKKVYINYKKNLKSGYITQNLLDRYNVGIIAVMLNRSIFNKYKFDGKYQIIGDFDFFIKLSMQYNFCFLNFPLATYRYHNLSFTNQNIKIYYEELKTWFKENETKLKEKKYNLNRLKLYFFKIGFKNYLNKIFS